MENAMFGDMGPARKHPWLAFLGIAAIGVVGLLIMWGLSFYAVRRLGPHPPAPAHRINPHSPERIGRHDAAW
jgi:drug/metabolite transporter (DMT)-like permease